MTRKRHPTIRTGMELPLAMRPTDDARPGAPVVTMSITTGNVTQADIDRTLGTSGQLERANALARAREEGERVGEIRGALAVLEPLMLQIDGVGEGDHITLDLQAPLHDLVRRFGAEEVSRAAGLRANIVQRILAIVIAKRNEPQQ